MGSGCAGWSTDGGEEVRPRGRGAIMKLQMEDERRRRALRSVWDQLDVLLRSSIGMAFGTDHPKSLASCKVQHIFLYNHPQHYGLILRCTMTITESQKRRPFQSFTNRSFAFA